MQVLLPVTAGWALCNKNNKIIYTALFVPFVKELQLFVIGYVDRAYLVQARAKHCAHRTKVRSGLILGSDLLSR